MKKISLELVAEIRKCIHDPFISNQLRLLDPEKWLQATAALDTIEDSANAINYYMYSNSPSELGGLYLHIYGLLQALSVSQDCVVALRKALLNTMTDLKIDSPDFYYVRNVRSDILHATDRGKANKSYIYLTQWSLSKPYFEYYKQTPGKTDITCKEVNVEELIEKNNKEVNRFLKEIKMGVEREIEMKKEKYSKQKLFDLFNSLGYVEEKLSENSHMAKYGYESTKTILKKYKDALDERYVSWKECCSDSYEIQFIDDIYEVLDSNILQKSCMPEEKIELIKKILVDDLLCHFRNLQELSKERDDFTKCQEETEDCHEVIINVVCPNDSRTIKDK